MVRKSATGGGKEENMKLKEIEFLPHSRDWFTESRGWKDVISCVLGKHQVVTDAWDGSIRIRRCSCGAFFDRGYWFYLTEREKKGKWRRK
jgi:hypothetical protein